MNLPLDVKLLRAENRRLKKQIARMLVKIDSLEKKNKKLVFIDKVISGR